MIRVLLVDDHAILRNGIINLFLNDKEIAFVDEAEDGTGLLNKYNDLRPDIIVTDISMPNRNGLDAIKTLTNKEKSAKALFLTQYTDNDYIYQAIKAGGKGLIGKNVSKEDLSIAIKTIYSGGEYFFGKTDIEIEQLKKRYRMIEGKESYKKEDYLNKRKRKVIALITNGYTNEKTAIRLRISTRTVEAHRYRLKNKLGIESFSELVKYAEQYFIEYREETIV